jgi:uncharacterized damage-inducible protein DinB
MKTEIEKIVGLLGRTFNKTAWHGPSVKETLAKVSPSQGQFRLTENTHSIIELVAHMSVWRTFVIKRLLGDNDFTINDDINFPNETDWLKAIADLDKSQSLLVETVKQFPHERLAELVPHSEFRYTFYTLLHGIIHHDLYHTGQISLIIKGNSQHA